MVLNTCQQMGYAAVLTLCFLFGLFELISARSFMEMCGMDENWVCDKNIEKVPVEIAEICEACGNYWGDVPGFGYCCGCSPKVFDFCMVAVLGYRR